MNSNQTTRRTRTALLGALAALLATVLNTLLGSSPASAHTAARHPARASIASPGITDPGSCPDTFTVHATIGVTGPTTVRYHWVREDGAFTHTRTLTFRGRGSHHRTVQTSDTDPYSRVGWYRLVVTAPNRVTSPTITYRTYCSPEVGVTAATASSVSALCSDEYTDLDASINVYNHPATAGLDYQWVVDGRVVQALAGADGSIGSHDAFFHDGFVPARGTTSHTAYLMVETGDGIAVTRSPQINFDTTCV